MHAETKRIMKVYRIGIASLVHDHVWGELKHWQATGRVELVAVGESNQRLRERAVKEFSIKKSYDSWQAMLSDSQLALDIVQIAAENSVHAEITEAAAARGCHVLTEKPMAASLAQAKRMVAATEKAGVQLLINWPTAWMPAYQKLERLISGGQLGQLRYFKYRSAHNGPKEIGCDESFYSWLYDEEKNGAGALMDYCCYGAAMSALFLGAPKKVIGLRAILAKDYPLPDDNAIINCQYDHAFTVAEASWTQVTGYVTGNPIAYGSEGSVCLQNNKLHLLRPNKAVEIIEPEPLQAPLRSAPEYLIHCLDNQLAVEGVCSSRVGLIAQEILEAGKRAADTGITQTLPLPDERRAPIGVKDLLPL
jgi:predicted dehydrogenase